MYDIKPLEEKWKQYNRKKKRPLYISIGLLFLIALAIYLIKFTRIAPLDSLSNPHNNSVIVTKTQKQHHVQKLLINDSLDEIETNEIQEEIKKVLPVEPIDEIPVLEEPAQTEVGTKTVKKKKVHKKIHLNIIETSSVSAYKDVAKRFYQAHDPDDSLFLAKAYFKKGNYKKAEYWALQTNKVNKNIEESWLIFVKSKVRQGHKNEAIHILESYLKRSHSKEAKNLLQKLKK